VNAVVWLDAARRPESQVDRTRRGHRGNDVNDPEGRSGDLCDFRRAIRDRFDLKKPLMDISKSANKYNFESGYLPAVISAIKIFGSASVDQLVANPRRAGESGGGLVVARIRVPPANPTYSRRIQKMAP